MKSAQEASEKFLFKMMSLFVSSPTLSKRCATFICWTASINKVTTRILPTTFCWWQMHQHIICWCCWKLGLLGVAFPAWRVREDNAVHVDAKVATHRCGFRASRPSRSLGCDPVAWQNSPDVDGWWWLLNVWQVKSREDKDGWRGQLACALKKYWHYIKFNV